MRLRCPLAACFVAVAVVQLHAEHIAPTAPADRATEYEANLRTFLKQGRFNYFGELKGRWEDSNQQFRYRSLTLGPYYRAYKNLKVGAFYRLQQGARHDDDWVLSAPPRRDVWGTGGTRARGASTSSSWTAPPASSSISSQAKTGWRRRRPATTSTPSTASIP